MRGSPATVRGIFGEFVEFPDQDLQLHAWVCALAVLGGNNALYFPVP